jgi:hypothetical protein
MIRRASRLFATWLLCSSAAAWAQTAALRTVQVFVALADNEHQGIVPVSAKLPMHIGASRSSRPFSISLIPPLVSVNKR